MIFKMNQNNIISNSHSNNNQNQDSYSEFENTQLQTTFSQCQTIFLQHNLPPISQPILTKYKSVKFNQDFNPKKFQTGLFCSFFQTKTHKTLSLCNCPKSQIGICYFMMNMIQGYYDWQNDRNFKKTYQHYNRKKIQIFLSEDQIQRRLVHKFELLGGTIHQNSKAILVRIIKNYIKHTVLYKKDYELTRENDLYFWFLIGIYYHVGLSSDIFQPQSQKIQTNSLRVQLCEPVMFWALDMVMNKLANLTKTSLGQKTQQIIFYMKKYFEQSFNFLVNLQIPITQLVEEWLNQFMISYMGIQMIGFFISSILKFGWIYVIKIILSHFQKRMDKLKAQQLFKASTDRQILLRTIIDSREQWPMIFANTQTFPF